jgi:hypothetical protein
LITLNDPVSKNSHFAKKIGSKKFGVCTGQKAGKDLTVPISLDAIFKKFPIFLDFLLKLTGTSIPTSRYPNKPILIGFN